MTETNIDQAVIKKTQDILGKYVKKPALSDKLLRKPPFRFLHDIVTAVIRDTGYFKGLYTDTELNSDNIKDRDGKIQFLQKIIDVIKLSVDKNLSVRPSRIVAGQEPEKTNELLQCIGTIIAKKVDCSESIEIIKNAEGKLKTKATKGEKEEKVKETKSKPEKEKVSKSKDVKEVEKPAKNKEEKVKVREKAKDKDKLKEKRKEKVKEESKTKEKEKVKKPAKEEPKKEKNATQDLSLEAQFAPVVEGSQQLTQDPFGDLPPVVPQATEKRPSSGSTSSKGKHAENDSKSSKKPKEESGRRESTTKVDSSKEDRRVSSKTRKEGHAERRESFKPTQELEELMEKDKPKETTQKTTGSEKEPTKTEMIDVIDQEAKSREKDGERRKSSGKRRQSVAENNHTDEQSKRSSKKSLIRQETAIVTDSKPPEVERKPQPPPPSSNETAELRRQTTFTRDNSDGNRPRTSLRPPSARPPSARPGAPRRRDKNVEIILQPNEQIKMAGINVKLDNINSELEVDAENLVVFEDSHIQDMDDFRPKEATETELDPSQQGYLVQQILETQKKLLPSEQEGLEEKEWDAGLSHKRQTSAKNMNSLRDAIQVLTRSVNPLGKFMDFLPEDIDSMHMELTMWRDTYMQTSAELKKERNLTETSIEPLKQQLAQINSNIKEHIVMVDSIRARILQSSEKIIKLFTEY